MAISLYNKKTVKSGVFLFPILGTSRYSEFLHKRTYIICRERGITEQSMKLIVSYPKIETVEFVNYERKMLSGSKYFSDLFEIGEDCYYIFDLSSIEKDWSYFLAGKYSRFSDSTKKRLMAYHIIQDKGVKKDNRAIQEILYPYNPTMTTVDGRNVDFTDAFEKHAPALGVSAQMLREVGEIYGRVDLKDELLALKNDFA